LQTVQAGVHDFHRCQHICSHKTVSVNIKLHQTQVFFSSIVKSKNNCKVLR